MHVKDFKQVEICTQTILSTLGNSSFHAFGGLWVYGIGHMHIIGIGNVVKLWMKFSI